jgi:hypothetical protein
MDVIFRGRTVLFKLINLGLYQLDLNYVIKFNLIKTVIPPAQLQLAFFQYYPCIDKDTSSKLP